MAFSGRARRPGAFSANAKPAEALSDAPFAGEWVDEDGELVRIKDSKIHASDGGIMQLTVKSKIEASFKMDGETYDGTLSSDGGKIIWSDGAAWTRKGAGGAAEDEEEKRKQAEASKKAAEEAARKKAEEEETARAAMEAKKQAQELARKKAQEEDMARRTAALEKAKAAAAAKAAAEEAAKSDEPAGGGAAGPSMEDEKARIQAGIDKAKSAFEAEKARKAAALERAKAAKAQQEAAAAAAPAADDTAKAQSQAGIDKARAAFEAEKARKAAALEKARAAKAAEAAAAEGGEKKAAAEGGENKAVDEAKAKSQAGLDKARAAFEAEKARKAAALEKARAAKAAEQEAAAQAQPPQDEAKAKSDAGLNKARAAFEAEKARKAAALEKARAAKAAEEAAAKEAAEGGQPKEDFVQAKAASTAGLNKAKAAFEAEKARKAAALEKARAAKAAAEAAKAAEEDEDDDEPPSLTTAAGGKRGSAFSAAVGKATAPAPAGRKPSAFSSALGQAQAEQAQAQVVDFKGPPKGKTMSAFSGAGMPQELQPPDPDSGPQVQVFSENAEPEIVGLPEADWEPGIVVKLKGLKTKPELNGQWGVLQEFNDAKKRWSVKPIDESLEEMALKADNLEIVSQEEYDKWAGDQANAVESAKYEVEAMLKSRVGMNKTRWSDSDAGKVVKAPGENGNDFDVSMGMEPDGKRAASKILDIVKEKGVCLVEANAETDAVYQAYEEAKALWNGGEFAPPMQDFGAGELEMTIWHHVLFQDDPKVKWIGEDAGENMQALRHLSNNMRDFANGLSTAAGVKLGIKWNNLWDGMLCCYTGDKSYAYHLDNPCMPDEHSLPDNGLRMTLAYFINTNWSPEDGYNGGGLEVYLSDPSGPPASLAQARKCNRIKIAPHADTLVVFPSQRLAHQVIATKGKGLYFCIWMWCFQEEVMEDFPRAVQEHWQGQSGEEVPGHRGSDQGDDDGEEVEEIED